MLVFLLACHAPSTVAPPVSGAVCPDDRPGRPADPPRTVLVISTDTVHRDFLGFHHRTWNVTPTLDALAAEGVRFDNVLAPRALSAPALASLATGAYPRTHTVRNNRAPDEDDPTVDPYPDGTRTLFTRAAEAGYTTWALWSNMCFVTGPVDHGVCTWRGAAPEITQEAGDAALVAELGDALGTLPANEPLFAWVHFMDPHDPYQRREPWYTEFHPDTYTGAYEDPTEAVLAGIADGAPYTEEDRRHVEAVYASQLRATDEHVAELVAALQEAGRWDDAVVLVAYDHGEELARRDTYFFHGCSPYNGALGLSFTLRAPGSVAPGEVLSAWVPSVDVVATFAEVVGLDWSGPQEGRSRWDEVAACVEPDVPAFFERGANTAGVVRGGYKYILDPGEGDSTCKHYDERYLYPGQPQELYNLEADPLELENLVEEREHLTTELRDALCDWVETGTWNEAPTLLTRRCRGLSGE